MRNLCLGAGRRTNAQFGQSLLLDPEIAGQVDIVARDAERFARDDQDGIGAPEVQRRLDVVRLADVAATPTGTALALTSRTTTRPPRMQRSRHDDNRMLASQSILPRKLSPKPAGSGRSQPWGRARQPGWATGCSRIPTVSYKFKVQSSKLPNVELKTGNWVLRGSLRFGCQRLAIRYRAVSTHLRIEATRITSAQTMMMTDESVSTQPWNWTALSSTGRHRIVVVANIEEGAPQRIDGKESERRRR